MSAPFASPSPIWRHMPGAASLRAPVEARRRGRCAFVCPAPSRSGNLRGRFRVPPVRHGRRPGNQGRRMMNLRKLLLGATAAAIAVAFSASAGAADKPVYGVLLKTLSNPFWGAMEKGIKDGAAAAGVEYFMQAVESDQAAEPQLNTCNTMLQRKPAVMITAAINSTILLPCLKQANDMGIPVVDLDANLDHAIAAKAGVKIAFTIGSDNVAAGKQGADWLAGKLGKDAKGPVLVIEGLSGNITGQKRAQGFRDELATAAPGLKVVASLPGDWDGQKAANITNDTLTRTPDLVAIFCANDTMALGAV